MPLAFDPTFEDLPPEIPVFPLTGVLLLPGATLPLNIFEPRYLNMTDAALAGSRMIGMIQPSGPNTGDNPELYGTGCAGRIVAFSETDDGRYLITLHGVIRFDLAEELPLRGGFRVVRPDWTPYRHDIGEEETDGIDRDRILQSLHAYFTQNKVDANWQAIKEAPLGRLVNSLAMMIPFQPSEKQAFLEARALADRADILTALLEMALASNEDYEKQKKN